MAELFEGAKLKVEWAEQRIEELRKALDEFVSKGAGARAVQTVENGRHSLFIKTDPAPPLTGLLLGDVLHNLRAALDYVAWELVEVAGGTPTTQTYFPIAETAKKSEERIDKGGLRTAGPEVCDVLLNAVKPYKGANQNLWALHAANNIDKHRLTIPTVAATHLAGFSVRCGGINMQDNTLGLMAGGQVGIIGNVTQEIHVIKLGTPTLYVSFPHDSEFGRAPLIPTLKEVADSVRQAIHAVEATYQARGS